MIVVDLPELSVPDEVAVEVDRDDPAAAKRGVDEFAVGGRGRRRRAVLVVDVLRATRRHVGFPQQATVGPAETEDRQPLAARAAGRQKDAVIPDNGDEFPRPGTAVFHTTLVVSDQVLG